MIRTEKGATVVSGNSGAVLADLSSVNIGVMNRMKDCGCSDELILHMMDKALASSKEVFHQLYLKEEV